MVYSRRIVRMAMPFARVRTKQVLFDKTELAKIVKVAKQAQKPT